MLAYHDWADKGIYYTYSYDLEHWEEAHLILANPGSPERIWYPTWIAERNDQYSEGKLFLAYAHWDNINLPYRNFELAEVQVLGLSMPQVTEEGWFTQSNLVLTQSTKVSLALFDTFGKLVYEYYHEETLSAGTYFINLAPYLAPGISFLKLTSSLGEKTQKIIRF